MAPETVLSDPPRPAGMSEISRLTGVFFEPKKAFTDIAERPSWLVPILLMIVVSFAVTYLYGQKGVFRIAVEQQLANSPQAAQLTAEQRQRQVDMGLKVATIIGYCVPILVPLSFLVMALVLWAIAAGILSAPIRFGQMFAIVSYAQLPGLIMSILILVVLQLKNIGDFNVQNPLMFNPGAFMDPQSSSKFVLSLATSLDLFTIWIMLLIATGIKAAAGKKLSFGAAIFAVMLPWAVVVLGRAALAGLSG
jgi:hypothetical protein